MRLAVFSDVHSNHHALKACLKEAEKQKADGYIFLGDYISDCANPHETMKLIYRAKQETPCWFVRGNREEYVLNHHNFGSDWANGTTHQEQPGFTPEADIVSGVASVLGAFGGLLGGGASVGDAPQDTARQKRKKKKKRTRRID